MHRKTYETFQAYFEANIRQQFAVWSEMEVAYHFAVDHCPELLEKAFSEAVAQLRKTPGRPWHDEDNYSNGIINSAKGGNNAAYLKARLARDRPDILERLKAGDYKSVRAAAIAAGIVEPRTPLQHVQTGWRHATLDDKMGNPVPRPDGMRMDTCTIATPVPR